MQSLIHLQWRFKGGGGAIRPCPQFGHIHCGQLILRKISKIGATRCQILRLKCNKFNFHLGSAPHPAGGAYSADLLAVFKGPTSKGREGERREREGEGKGRGG